MAHGLRKLVDTNRRIEMSNSTDNMKGTARRVWGLDGDKVPTMDEEEIVTEPTLFEEWASYELPVKTIKEFLESDATPEAVISFSKRELQDYMEKEVEKEIERRVSIILSPIPG